LPKKEAVVVGAAGQRIVSRVAGDDVSSSATIQDIVAAAAMERIVAVIALDAVAGETAKNGVIAAIAGGGQSIVAVFEIDCVVAGTAMRVTIRIDDVVAVAAVGYRPADRRGVNRVVAGAAIDFLQILASAAVENVVAFATVNQRGEIAGYQRVVTAHTKDDVRLAIIGRPAPIEIDVVVIIAALQPADAFNAGDRAAAYHLRREVHVEADAGGCALEADEESVDA